MVRFRVKGNDPTKLRGSPKCDLLRPFVLPVWDIKCESPEKVRESTPSKTP